MVALHFDLADERDRRARDHKRIRQLVRDLGITVFDTYSPLAVGIHAQLAELLAGEADAVAIARFLRHHTSRIPYLEAIARGEPRRDMNGIEAEPPTEDQRQYATRGLAIIAKRKAAKRGEAV
jgi:sRNA-binding protein